MWYIPKLYNKDQIPPKNQIKSKQSSLTRNQYSCYKVVLTLAPKALCAKFQCCSLPVGIFTIVFQLN